MPARPVRPSARPPVRPRAGDVAGVQWPAWQHRAWLSDGSRPRRRATSTSATSAPRCWPGCSPGRPARAFLLRVDDLDPATARDDVAAAQLDDLRPLGARLGRPDRPPARPHRGRTATAIAELVGRGLTYPCYCSRREILEASAAPHGEAPEGAYPGHVPRPEPRPSGPRAGRHGADPRRCGCAPTGERVTVVDRLHGPVTAVVDDLVLRRGDGVPAYNLAVRGRRRRGRGSARSCGATTCCCRPRARRTWPAARTGRASAYAHVPLVLAPDGARLAKRDGAVTLADRPARGESPDDVRVVAGREPRAGRARRAGVDGHAARPVRPGRLPPSRGCSTGPARQLTWPTDRTVGMDRGDASLRR